MSNKENIPKLRFKEFSGEWEEKATGQVLKIGSGKDYKHLENGNIPVYGTGGLMTYVNDYLYDGVSVCIGRKGTIDKPMLLSGKFWTVDTLFYTHSFKESIPEFIFSIFQKINWKLYNEASGVPSLSKATIEKVKVNVPKKQEQEKIASFLSSIDKKINQLSKKDELLQNYKKAMMQKIFSQKLRFKKEDGSDYPKWEKYELKEFLIERVEYPEELLPIYSLTIEKGIIPKSERYERAFLVKSDYEYKTMKENDFAYNPMNLRFGALARHKEKLDVMVSKYYNIFYCNEKLNSYFAVLYFTNYNSIQFYNKMATGSLEEKKRVHFREFLKFKFSFPTIEEQTKIANFLSSLDTKISQNKKALEETQRFKKALLQKMFV
ncbi:restriction endonuclease subunit S [Halarcobacter mediterraneus]|uniref:Restriction endonuclease subunit S n=1 Tax=Halarcobacter mediterraneus TaxID=2023153 RepID=A0A4Q1B7K1_9BACT|nr:restriction endonuclease subunit S [Halarcobacter mediterraneus]RXK14579.1 restriction endonuclease subunit S [Halarcobacter mediterraneus]